MRRATAEALAFALSAVAFSAVAADLEAVLTALTTGRLLPLRLDLGAILRDQADSLLARTDALQAANADYATVDGDAFGWWESWHRTARIVSSSKLT